MNSRNTEEIANAERLRAEYKGAFEEWAHEVSKQQAADASPDSQEEAAARVAAAETAYRTQRDKLTEDMALAASKSCG